MHTNPSQPVTRTSYRPYPYELTRAELIFDLDTVETYVTATLHVRQRAGQNTPLVLDGNDVELLGLDLNGRTLASHEYQVTDDTLTLHPDTDTAIVTVRTRCRPAENTTLMGLYQSGAYLFTQCEAEGFRRITWFPDRPDVMSTYHVTLRADKTRFPQLLSNGNLVSTRDLDGNRHEAVWHDPHLKPSYLFALVAGDFAVRETTIQTASGRPVRLQLYSEPEDRDRTAWALECLENAVRWDEQRFGLELDLDRFMVVAARDFNMGAMENKGLNIFNASYVLASPDTATDQVYRIIEAVVGHEYFHNWTGNRVTCRDWFQLSLKEGLTVFREQEFSADMMAAGLQGLTADSARAVKRIDDVNILRTQQFPEDAGPMAHSVRPESYYEISNFYTATIYEKGAEIVRMLHTLLGEETFQAGMREYFRRHDGQAVTCDDFVAAMESARLNSPSSRSLGAFSQWYSQAGTPRITFRLEHEADSETATLTLQQHQPETNADPSGRTDSCSPALTIPIAIGMLDPQGHPIALEHEGSRQQTVVLELQDHQHSWTFTNIKQPPVVSLLRGFSAPVIVETKQDSQQLRLLAMHDPDPFGRWEALQQLTVKVLGRHQQSEQEHNAHADDQALSDAWQHALTDPDLADDYRARLLTLMPVQQLMHQLLPMDPVSIVAARRTLQKTLGSTFHKEWLVLYEANSRVAEQPWQPTATDAGKRALRMVSLGMLCAGNHEHAQQLALDQYQRANNLTDRLNALKVLTEFGSHDAAMPALEDFYEQAREPSLMDQWFSLHAGAVWADADSVKALTHHEQFTHRNPNRARALIFRFCLQNPAVHTPKGYQFWQEQIQQLDALNPEIAARLTRGLDHWRSYASPYRSAMQNVLQRLQQQDLSTNVREIITAALEP